MLDIDLLPPDALRQVYDWDHGEKFEPFKTYAARLSGPNWTHYAIKREGRFIGCLSLELTGPTTCSIHLAKRPGSERLSELRQLMFAVANTLFDRGFQSLLAEVRKENRAARQLAVLCGMSAGPHTETHQYYTLTAQQYYQSWMRESLYGKTKAAGNAFRE